MILNDDLLKNYENSKLVHYDEIEKTGLATIDYADLDAVELDGVLKSSMHVDGKLRQVYTERGNHVGVISATRLGKTTSYVIPTVLSFAKQKRKKSMIISDPKGEIYRHTAETLRAAGYNVKLLNFRDYMHSECWNILTPIYRKYHSIKSIRDEVELVNIDGVWYNKFRGAVYHDQTELDNAIEYAESVTMNDVANDIDTLTVMFVETFNTRDPYWEDSARDLLKAFLWAMLEDSDEGNDNRITEDTFSFASIFRVVSAFRDTDDSTYEDYGYFSNRGDDSQAYRLAKNILIENAKTTRKCIMSTFLTKLSVFRQSTIQLISSCNSFQMSELTDGPTAFFIDYRDELKSHYKLISIFVQDAYRYMIEQANESKDGKLETPFYFVLDEFGNFPQIPDFETTISACAGRNIFFILVIQSYAQLANVYGPDVATIIRDNLNVHVFFGSNNPATLEEFSRECGEKTQLSLLSALNGTSAEIDRFEMEKVALVPKSRLSRLEEGECMITEANSGYVMLSKLERYYKCPEFNDLPQCNEREYVGKVNPCDKRYRYAFKPGRKQRRSSMF